MRGWSFPVGRLLGVEVRLHMFFLLLLVMSVSYTTVAGVSGARGVALWGLLVFAVAVRETARAVAMTWWGLDLRALVLLPTGALPTYGSREDTERAAKGVQQKLALVGPIANLGMGVLLAAMILGMTREIGLGELMGQPWITPKYLLRSMIWMQVLLGAINLLPAFPLDGGRVLRGEFAKAGGGLKRARLGLQVARGVSVGLIVAGILSNDLWVMMMGVFLLVGARMDDQGVRLESDVAAVKMRDVMLTEFSTISASATLEDAVERVVHSLQDVFPVVRGRNLVGAVSRQGIFEALGANGNGYVQGVMARSFHTAEAEDSLMQTLERITTGVGAQLVPVLEGQRVVGIVTPQNLSQSMAILSQTRRLAARKARMDQLQGDE